MINFFTDQEYLPTLQLKQLADFDSIWNLEMKWFEDPNHKRGGWSGVGRVTIKLNNGEKLNLFIKKQENHGRFTWFSPVKGEPTFRREFKRLRFLRKIGFAVPRVVFYGESNENQKQRAILVTVALDEYSSLENLAETWLINASHAQKTKLIIEVARGISAFHKLGFVHRALYPKHIFIKNVEILPEMALIDLEKTRYSPLFFYRAYFDLSVLHRRLVNVFSSSDCLKFFKEYFRIKSLANHPSRIFFKWLCRAIYRRSQRH